MRRAILAVVACTGLWALSTPTAAANVVDVGSNVCTGTAKWNVNLAGAYADINHTMTCKWAHASVEDNGNPHVNATDGPYTGGFRVSLIGVNVTGTNSFVGTAIGFVGGGPVEVVSPNILNATLEGVDPSRPATSTEEHVGIESCGTNCYRTQVRVVGAWDRLP